MAKSTKAFMLEQHSKAHTFHEAAAEQHGAIAEHHAGAAEDHTALAEAFDGEPAAEHHKSLAGHHGHLSKGHAKLMKLHAGHAEDHAQAMELCDKADAGGDLEKSFDMPGLHDYIAKTVTAVIGDQLVPSSVSAIAPQAPGFGIRSVPRAGEKKAASSEAPKVALEFSKVFSLNDNEELRQ